MPVNTTTALPVVCPHGPAFPLEGTDWLEENVTGFFRVWHMIFLCAGGVLTLIIFICCIARVRIPRTKQDIEADFKRKKITRKFRQHLDKMEIEDTDLKDALERVSERVNNDTSEVPNGSAPVSETSATTPASTRSMTGNAVTPNSVAKPAPLLLPQASQSSTEEEAATRAETSNSRVNKNKTKNSASKTRKISSEDTEEQDDNS